MTRSLHSIQWATCEQSPNPIWESKTESLRCWKNERIETDSAGTHLGFVLAGTSKLTCAQGEFDLKTGMYFSASGSIRLSGGTGFFVSRRDYQGFFHLGGPVEELGRLKYIDGCSDSLLIPPVMLGDPCLNFLSVPPHVSQSSHTHPSHRIGLVISGSGVCHCEAEQELLEQGRLFVLPADLIHSFETTSESLRIVVYHPDSDCGPTHESHPMLNRTLLS